MTESTAAERELVRDALAGLALAVRRSDELDAAALEKTSETKVEKFLYEALHDDGALGEVTHSWYLAGAKTEATAERSSTDRLQTAYQRVTGEQGQSSAFVDERERPEASERVASFAEFYTNRYDLAEQWYTPGEEFLLDFYQRRAPKQYRELYVSVQRLRNLLSETDRELYRLASNSGQDTTLADFGQTATLTGPDHYDEVTDLVSRIHLELASDEALSEVLSEFRAFTDLLEDVFLALRETAIERIGPEQQSAFKSLKRFQFYEAWRLPALVISRETAAGPGQRSLRRERAQTLERKRREFQSLLAEQREACAGAALSPPASDYESTLGGDAETDEFLRRYLTRR